MSVINHYVVSKSTNLAGYIAKTRLDKVYVSFESGASVPISIFEANNLLYLSERTKKIIDKKIEQLAETNI